MQKYIRLGAQTAKHEAFDKLVALVRHASVYDFDRARLAEIRNQICKIEEALTILEQPTYK